jgi:hypothetical protein
MDLCNDSLIADGLSRLTLDFSQGLKFNFPLVKRQQRRSRDVHVRSMQTPAPGGAQTIYLGAWVRFP